MYRLLISGHGRYGYGLADNIRLITGNKKIIVVDFVESMTTDQYEKIVKELVNDGNIICICDIIGGTPFQTLARMSQSISEMYVLTGITSMALIEWEFNHNIDIEEQLNNLIETSKNSITIYQSSYRNRINDI